ncbi:MAG: glycosyltransferase family 39 protein [Peptococcaceae bacterium]|nr:glycosyltransferase family 39 protein [Peptococcaceae bacterium]
MKKIRENIALAAIMILSAVLNFTNLYIEGYSNQYYAAGVKSMTQSFKNFFFVALDPAGFVTVDKPPLGFWMQAISAKIFGFSGWSILFPQALAGVVSVGLLFFLVKRSFGSKAGLLSALFLAITPVFVAVSRNNTVDNQLVLALLLACWALLIAAEKGKLRYLILCMVFIGLGFNIKMLQAYMILPAVYILYLFSSSISFRKRMIHLIAGTMILLLVSFSWAIVVDSIPSTDRPYVGSSNDNTVMGLILGHNGAERLGGIFGIFKTGVPQNRVDDRNNRPSETDNTGINNPTESGMQPGFPNDYGRGQNPPGNTMQPPSGGGPGGGFGGGDGGGLSGTFGNQTPAGITRLFSKNVLSDQIVWFIPLAVLGFIAAALREKLRFRLDNKRKQALILWLMWFLPEFVYFSFNTGLFHSYYLTMMAPPISALAGIGLISMWEMYKEGGWESWLLPLALIANGAVQMLMLTYFYNSSYIVKMLMVLLVVFCFGSAIALSFLQGRPKERSLYNLKNEDILPGRLRMKKIFISLALAGLMAAPAAGSAAAMFTAVSSTFPGAGLELLSAQQGGKQGQNMPQDNNRSSSTSDLISFLNNNPVDGKGQIVVSSANTAESLILQSDIYVGSLSGFMGNEKVMSLEQFQKKVQSGEIRYVLAEGGNNRGGSGSEIMSWVKENGQLVLSGQVYDLISYTKN